jgi:hypothetical protein
MQQLHVGATHAEQGIVIGETNTGITVPASIVPVWYRKKMPDCVAFVRYGGADSPVSLFQSGTRLGGRFPR